MDDPEKYDAAPAAVQILGRRLEEEKLLSIAQIVIDALNEFRRKQGSAEVRRFVI